MKSRKYWFTVQAKELEQKGIDLISLLENNDDIKSYICVEHKLSKIKLQNIDISHFTHYHVSVSFDKEVERTELAKIFNLTPGIFNPVLSTKTLIEFFLKVDYLEERKVWTSNIAGVYIDTAELNKVV